MNLIVRDGIIRDLNIYTGTGGRGEYIIVNFLLSDRDTIYEFLNFPKSLLDNSEKSLSNGDNLSVVFKESHKNKIRVMAFHNYRNNITMENNWRGGINSLIIPIFILFGLVPGALKLADQGFGIIKSFIIISIIPALIAILCISVYYRGFLASKILKEHCSIINL